MDRNTLIGLLVAVIVIGAGVWVWTSSKPGTTTTPTSTTTTTQTGTTNTGTTPTPASAPIVSTASGAVVSNSTAVVNGHVTPDGAQTSYWYEYGKTTALGAQTKSQAIGSGRIAISAPGYITGLSADTKYYFRLVAKNAVGTVNGTVQTFTTNTTPPPVSNAPTTQSVDASGLTRTTANLNGRVTPNGSEASYWFEYGTSAELGNTTAFQSAGSGSSATSVSASVSGLKPLTKYYFRLDAQNQFGTVNGAILTFTTAGPAAPSQPTVDTTLPTRVATSTATLNGRVNPNGDNTTYWFEYSDTSLFGSILGSTTHTAIAGAGTSLVNVSSDVEGLTPDTAYFSRLVASNSLGTVRGDAVSFKTKP